MGPLVWKVFEQFPVHIRNKGKMVDVIDKKECHVLRSTTNEMLVVVFFFQKLEDVDLYIKT